MNVMLFSWAILNILFIVSMWMFYSINTGHKEDHSKLYILCQKIYNRIEIIETVDKYIEQEKKELSKKAAPPKKAVKKPKKTVKAPSNVK